MDILLISPDQADDENLRRWRGALVQDALSLTGLRVQPLLGNIRTEDVIRAVNEKRYDVLMMLGHNTDKGIQLSGKRGDALKGLDDEREFLSPAAIASLARAGPRLVYLLSCETVESGQIVMESAGVDVICSVPMLLVDEAYRTASLWLRALSRNNGDFRAAFEQARPPNLTYLYLSTGRKTFLGTDDLPQTLSRLDRDLSRHENHLSNHEIRLNTHDEEVSSLKKTVNRETPLIMIWLVLGIIGVSGVFVLLLVFTLTSMR